MIDKQKIKDLIQESRIAMRQGNIFLNQGQYISAYRCYQGAEHLLYAAKSLIVEPNEIHSSRTDTVSGQ